MEEIFINLGPELFGGVLLKIRIQKADRRHLADINRLIRRIGGPLDRPPGYFWFVRVDNFVVGCVGVELIGKGAAALTYLAVDEKYRKRGIGMALFYHAIRFARNRGATIVAFATMYYHFNRFKKQGFEVRKRKLLPLIVQSFWMFTAKRYMKCAVMIKRFK